MYGAKQHFTPDEDTRPNIDQVCIRRVQGIIGALLYYKCTVDNKLLMSLSAIGTKQAAATESNAVAIYQLLDYVAMYPNDGIIYRATDMIMCAHYDTAYIIESKTRSRSGSLKLLLEDDPTPRINESIITLAKIIKFVMSSAAEAELAGLLITSKKMIPLLQTLIDMECPQPKSPIQTDNHTAVGVINRTLLHKNIKYMDMCLWWLRCRDYQGQFRLYWASGSSNEAYCPTKHHPDIYHETKRPLNIFSWAYYKL